MLQLQYMLQWRIIYSKPCIWKKKWNDQKKTEIDQFSAA